MTRRCSHCAQQNHNSRTCPERGVRLFGVRINDQQAEKREDNMRKSASMGNLSNYSCVTAEQSEEDKGNAAPDGYLSDGLVHGTRDRKRGKGFVIKETFDTYLFLMLVIFDHTAVELVCKLTMNKTWKAAMEGAC